MGPMFWKPQSPTHLKKCDEFKVGPCNTETDDCCGVLPCRYCITFVGVYDTYYGTATFTNNGWLGTINGSTFFAYWERNYDTNECEFIVLIDSYEVYRKSCYEGQSCRDSSDSVETTIGGEYGTLSWLKHELRPLEYVIDYETGCRVHFCGSCECTCDCLCVTITDPPEEGSQVHRGEICDTAYPCDGPVWSGTVNSVAIEITLTRGEYGECVLGGSVGGEALEDQTVAACDAISATWTLYDGTEVTVACKECVCEEEPPCLSCCGGVYPTTSLYLTFTLLNVTPRCACLDGLSIELVYQGVITNELNECEVRWEGRAARPCPNGLQFNAIFICRSSLDSSPAISQLEVYVDSGVGTPQTDWLSDDFDFYSASCDPYMFCIRSNVGFPLDLDQECGDGTVDDDQPQLELCVTQ